MHGANHRYRAYIHQVIIKTVRQSVPPEMVKTGGKNKEKNGNSYIVYNKSVQKPLRPIGEPPNGIRIPMGIYGIIIGISTQLSSA